MHALPEKLAALRHEVEDGVRRQLVEHQARTEKDIKDACERAEEAAFRRASERLEPQLAAVAHRFDGLLVPMRSRLEEVSLTWKQSLGKLRQEVTQQKDDVNKRLIELRAELVPLNASSRTCGDSIRALEASEKDFRNLITSMRKDLSSSSEGLRDRLDEEVKRAEGNEASIRYSVHDVVHSLTAAKRTLAEHGEQMAQHATQQAEQQAFKIEGRLWKRLDAHAQEIALQAVSAKITDAAKEVERQLAEHRGAVEAHATRVEAKLKDECHAVAAGLASAAEVAARRAALEHAERHADTAARHAVQAKREIEDRCLAALGEAREASAAGALDWHAALGAQGDSLRSAVRRAEEHADEVAQAAELRAADETKRQLSEALAELHREIDAQRGELLHKEELAREDLRERLQHCLHDCREHANAAAERHEATSEALVARLVLHPEAARPQTAETDESEPSPDPPARRVGDPPRTFSDEAAGLRRELRELQQGIGREVSLLRSEIADRLTRKEACESAVTAATVTSEALGRVAALEAALTKQRERIDSAVRDLSSRCDACRVDFLDARARSQQEAHLLGIELAQQRAAGTSLVQGVCRALQVLGLLREVPEAEPHQAPDGDPASPARRSRGGMELGHLLDWEASGKSMAVQVAQQWRSVVAAPWPSNLIELLLTKADQKDLLAVRASLRLFNPAPVGPVGPSLALALAHTATPKDHVEGGLSLVQGKTGLHPQPPITPRGQLAPLAPWRKGGEATKAA